MRIIRDTINDENIDIIKRTYKLGKVNQPIVDKHKVTKIISGIREVLVVWVNPTVKERELI
jgi:hypothetical protein